MSNSYFSIHIHEHHHDFDLGPGYKMIPQRLYYLSFIVCEKAGCHAAKILLIPKHSGVQVALAYKVFMNINLKFWLTMILDPHLVMVTDKKLILLASESATLATH